ncbi:MAG: WYL domain-containing protein [Bacteroidetes bacterium]|jgi:predicted DNA-binding transcriptional regulator YafY|nr:WYL domain-containing protein [Bacteroidota bacterium]
MASTEHEYGTKARLLRVLIAIQEQPYRYTKRELAELYGVDPDTIKHDIESMRNAGFQVKPDQKHRYGFAADKPFEDLKALLQLEEAEQLLLLRALGQVDAVPEKLLALQQRLAAIFGNRQDYPGAADTPGAVSTPGPEHWRRPYLTKFQLLQQAREQKCQVVLLDYRSSNSNQVGDRLVEPFHARIEDDTVQAFDVDKQALRHFRISRIRRIRMTDTSWAHESKHQVLATDPFRIVEDQQVLVHLRLQVGAYNELVERYPLTKAYIQEDAERDNVYDFQCRVNHNFYGLTNFILGFHHQVIEVIAPEELKRHLERERERMWF